MKHLHVTDEGDEVELTIRSHKEVCPRCHGNGSHVNPAVDGNGITWEQMDELGPEFLEDYLRGLYDVPCQECDGQRVVDVPDESDPNFAIYMADLEAEADYRAEREAEIRMGY